MNRPVSKPNSFSSNLSSFESVGAAGSTAYTSFIEQLPFSFVEEA